MPAVGHALLGLLAREPLSGTEPTGQIKARVGAFWSTSHSQVSPSLPGRMRRARSSTGWSSSGTAPPKRSAR